MSYEKNGKEKNSNRFEVIIMKITLLRYVLSKKINKSEILIMNIGLTALGVLCYLIGGSLIDILSGLSFGLFLTFLIIFAKYTGIKNYIVFAGPISSLNIQQGKIIERLNEVSYIGINPEEKQELEALNEDYDEILKLIKENAP